MIGSELQVAPPAGPAPAGRDWRERALARSTASVRSRSAARLARLVDAARALAAESGSSSFTVDQVVARSGFSRKSFYAHFASKDELLLALFEEESRRGTAILAEMMSVHEDPLEQLRAYVAGLFSLVTVASGYAMLLGREHLRLEERYPVELQAAIAPLVDLLAVTMARAADEGVIRAGDARRDAVLVFNLVLAHIHSAALGLLEGDPADAAEYLWEFCRAALEAREPVTRTRQ